MADFNFEDLTEEQKAAIQEFLYKNYSEQPSSDESQFVVPFIAMNDGHTPAQIKAIVRGLYKDIQRNPFLRKTGTFTAEGKIEDIDITPLVYYGTLQQAKIAPTLENIDVKLYFREPKLHKVPSDDPTIGEYADTYIWRELPAGFHVYNNDTVYGYEWLVLQDNYVNTKGIYNLHMNIEDGIGACKFAGTQAPINLAGVQYKIVITAKNLWNREFSLLDSMPLLHSLTANSDELAPTVNAIKEYYAKAVETLKVVANELYVADAEDPVLYANKDGVEIKALKLGEITNLESFVKALSTDLDGHITAAVDHAEYDEEGKLLAPHGIKNTGFSGNIAAHSLDGLTLSNGLQALAEDVVGKYAYIPYVANDNSIGLGTTVSHYIRGANVNPSLIYKRTFEALPRTNTLNIVDISGQDELSNVLYSLSVGTNIFNASLKNIDGTLTLKLSSGNSSKDPVKLEVAEVRADRVDFGAKDVFIDKAWVEYINGQSTIAHKIPISELLVVKVKDTNLGALLVPNKPTDSDGYPADTWDTTNLEDHDLRLAAKEFTKDGFNTATGAAALDKLGSALQALYELPLSTYEYKRGQASYKEQIGIFVERVNQFRDHLAQLRGSGEGANGVPSEDNYLVHKRATCLQSNNAKIVDHDKGLSTADNSLNQGTDFTARVANNEYTYTEEEIKSIAHYLDLMTSKQELQHEIRNTVGILLKAAKETQERLIDVETAVYGFDAETIPGSDAARKAFVDGHIATELQTVLNSSPLLLGLNRLMRAVCLELYNTTDLESIDAEIRSVVGDSDTLKDKVTVKSRMDKVDDILSDLTNQASAITRYYTENIFNDEIAHTYADLYNTDETKQTITKDADIVEDEHILDNVADDHTETKDVDKNRAWKNLPSTEDVSKEAKAAVPFASIADSTHKHTPKADESGSVRVPEVVEFEHKDVDKDGKATTRVWKRFILEKDKETGTYHPKFKTKGVAWDQAKLERINKKLSEVTKDIYGTDDVTASLPNRTEVLRRNVTNLVDDLYPNRSFAVEKKYDVGDTESDIRLPFKTSNIQIPEEGLATVPQTDEPEETEKHTSIITWFDNELFNFKVVSNYVKTYGESNTRSTFEGTKSFVLFDEPQGYFHNKQITLKELSGGARDGTIIFDSSKLVTDENVFDPENYGTYKKAYSRLDMLENIIGLKDCYVTDLFHPSIDGAGSAILDTFGIDAPKATVLEANAYLQDLTKVKLHLQALVETLSSRIQVASNQISAVQSKLDNFTETNIAPVQADIDTATAKIAEYDRAIENLNATIANLQENSNEASTEATSAETAYNAAIATTNEKLAAMGDAKNAYTEHGIELSNILTNTVNSSATYERIIPSHNGNVDTFKDSVLKVLNEQCNYPTNQNLPTKNKEIQSYGISEETIVPVVFENAWSRIEGCVVGVNDYKDTTTFTYDFGSILRSAFNEVADFVIKDRDVHNAVVLAKANSDLKSEYDAAMAAYEAANDPTLQEPELVQYKNIHDLLEVPELKAEYGSQFIDVDNKIALADDATSEYNLPVLYWSQVYDKLVTAGNQFEEEKVKADDAKANTDIAIANHTAKSDEDGINYKTAEEAYNKAFNDQEIAHANYVEKTSNLSAANGDLRTKEAELGSTKLARMEKAGDLALLEAEKRKLEVTANAYRLEIESWKDTKRSNEAYKTATEARLEEIASGLDGVYDLLPSYKEELAFEDLRATIGLISSEERDVANSQLLNSSNLGYVLSRKQKTLQERVTTLEAFADEISKGFATIDNCRLLSESVQINLKDSEDLIANLRFESQNAVDTLHHLAEMNNNQYSENMIFDLDLSESFKAGATDMTNHNADVWKIVKNSKEVIKKGYAFNEHSYLIYGKLAVDPNYMNFMEKDENGRYPIQGYYVQWAPDKYEVKVNYISDASEISANPEVYYRTIYLRKKTTTTDLERLYNTSATKTAFSLDNVLEGSEGWQNQTEYNIYKTMSNMFTSLMSKPANMATPDPNSLYYQFMLLAHPVGSYYVTPADAENPRNQFGGTWEDLGVSYLPDQNAPSVTTPSVVNGWSNNTNGTSLGVSTSVSSSWWYVSSVSSWVSPNPHSHSIPAPSTTKVIGSISDPRKNSIKIWKRIQA